MHQRKERVLLPSQDGRKPLINLRILLFAVTGLAFGILLYFKIRFHSGSLVEFLLFAFLLGVGIFPLKCKRIAIVLGVFVAFAGVGAGLSHLQTERFCTRKAEGEYTVLGTVEELTVKNGYSFLVLGDLFLDGDGVGGKMYVNLSSEEVRTGDKLFFEANLAHTPVVENGNEVSYYFTEDIRYTANASTAQTQGKSSNFFLLINASVYDSIAQNMGKTEAGICYALIVGNAGAMDAGLNDVVRKGGIAHIFAVSGLHIGILYGAVYALCKFLGKWRALPALAVALGYCAFCAFTVSALRALIMCAVLSLNKSLGRKTDFLTSLSLAGTLILLFLPQSVFSAGFLLSFGACVGLALFSGTFARGMRKLHVPAFLANLLSASFSAQLFTFPIAFSLFGYVSLWGTLLNLVLVPLLPVLFLGLLFALLFALIIPPWATFFLALPSGMTGLLSFALASFDLSFVLTGFSLGAGGAIAILGMVFLSERVRMKGWVRGVVFACFAGIFALCLCARNLVPYGCKLQTFGKEETRALLLRTNRESVLVLGEDYSLANCQDCLARNLSSPLSAVVVLGDDAAAVCNVAVFLGAERIYVCEEVDTGLQNAPLFVAERFEIGEVSFCYETNEKLVVFTQDKVVEVDFTGENTLSSQLFIGKDSVGLTFFIKNSIIKRI